MTFKRLLSYLKPYKKSIIITILIVIISSIITIFVPKLTGNIISSLYNSYSTKTSYNTKYIYTTLITISIFYLISFIASYIENILMSSTCQKAINNLKNETYEKLSKLNINYYKTHQAGEIMSKINNDIEIISSLFLQTIPKITNYTITFIGILIMMFAINIKLTLITLVFLPLSLIISKLLLKLSKRKYQEYHQKYGYINSLILESYTNQETISLYNNEEHIINNFKTLNKNLSKTSIKASLITNIITPISSLINYIVYLFIIILGSKYVLEKKLLLGDIQALIQYTKQLSSPINSFSSLLASIQTSLAASERVFKLLDEEEEIHHGKEQLNEIKSIEFKSVNFSYNNSPLIENFNLKINKGEKIAIIGETGSGKSTIIKLLMQFYKINNGDILINDKSIYNYDLTSYYKNISYISQNVWLYNDTIINNLKFANFNISEKELLNTCKHTNSYNLINNLPNKLEEIIDEDDTKLSNGEKQLLVISRALIKEHDLLIQDEATSNIDSKNEAYIQNAIDTLLNDKTVIIIAHRLSTILKADKIIVLKDGKIIESGNHTSLYNKKGEYYNYLQTL